MVGTDLKERRYIYILSILIIFSITLFVWSVDKGFDITDEGFYLLNYKYPQEYNSSFTSFNLVVNHFVNNNGTSIISYRLFGVISVILSSIFVSIGLCIWLKNQFELNSTKLLMISLFVINSSFLQYSVGLRTISYNNVNSLFISIYTCAILLYISKTSEIKNRIYEIILIIGGFSIGLNLFVKSSSSIAACSLGLLVLVLYSGKWKNILNWLKPIGLIILGYSLGIGYFFLVIQDFTEWKFNFSHEVNILLSTSYNGGLILRYVNDIYPIAKSVIYPFSLPISLAFLIVYYSPARKDTLMIVIKPIAIITVTLIVIYQAWKTDMFEIANFNQSRSVVWFIAILLIVLFMYLAYYLKSKHNVVRINNEMLIVCLWLAVLPFLGAVGTFNNIFLNAIFDIHYWFALLCVLYFLLPVQIGQNSFVKLIVFIFPVLVVIEQYTYGLVYTPYQQAENMLAQTVAIDLGNSKDPQIIKVDKGTAHFIERIKNSLYKSGFRKGMPIIAIYDMPGLVYALGGISPGNPWYFSAGLDVRNCDALNKSKLNLSNSFVITNSKSSELFLDCLSSKGIVYPSNRIVIDTILNPYSLSDYNWRKDQDKITVLAPNVD